MKPRENVFDVEAIEAQIKINQEREDNFAIAFHQWMRKNDTQENAEKYFHYTDKDMLNAFKEEKGL